jgi:hypothetical protein
MGGGVDRQHRVALGGLDRVELAQHLPDGER